MSRDKRLDALNSSRGPEYWNEAPPRWLNCPTVGDIIEGRFLPFKVPLDQRYDTKVPVANRFGLEDVFTVARNAKKDIGAWIDLTKTSRFYNKKEVENRGINYRKMACGGHEEAPSPQQVKLFIAACDKLSEENPAALIGVHCTHGFNRTGFMVCAFLVEKCDWSVDAAIKEFAKARPPGIYKQNYLKELYVQYDDPDFDPVAPELPEWCYEEQNVDLEDDGNGPQGDHPADGDGAPSTGRSSSTQEAEFMDHVPGVTAVTDAALRTEIQSRCRNLCGWKRHGFPGSQPVSMGLDNLSLLQREPYRVSWKADGVRYMMFLDGEDGVFFLDRNNHVFSVTGMSFPSSDRAGQLRNTLLDGEMILDKLPDGSQRARYLIYDVVHSLDIEVGQRNFDLRCDYIKKEIIGPRERDYRDGLLKKETEPFSIRWKEFWRLVLVDLNKSSEPQFMAEKLLAPKFSATMSHEVDGLVFQPVKLPYVAGRCDHVLKWKPPHLCTVDFRLKVVSEGGAGMIPKTKGHLYVNGQDSPFGVLSATVAEMRKYDGKILECKYDQSISKWKLLRERTDKSFPNAITTAQSVFDGIMRPLTQNILFRFIREKSCDLPTRKRPREEAHPPAYQKPPALRRPDFEEYDPSAPPVY